jgi:hypothetical protein
MDALERMISEKRSEVAALLARADLLKAELSALELAARLRPVADSRTHSRVVVPNPARAGGGRKPGDISHDWRGILGDVYRLGMAVDYEMIAEVAKERGTELAMSSIRDRVRNLTRTGLMEGDTQQGFVVSEDAVKRFGFTKENDGQSVPSDEKAGEAGTLPGFHNPNPSRLGA